MSDDRRASVRRQAELPFAWQRLPHAHDTLEVCRALGLPAAIALQSRMAELDEEVRRLSGRLSDPDLADALRALNDRIAVVEEALLADTPAPRAHPVAVSADGVGFESEQPLEEGDWLAVHLVLPVSYQVVCSARVTHCATRQEGGYQVGAELHGLPAPAARRLTRYAISRNTEGN